MEQKRIRKMTEDQAREYLEGLRWPNGPVCPKCGHIGAYRIRAKPDSRKPARKGLWACKACRKQFTVTVGTIFERSHISLADWVFAFSKLCASKKSISALQLQRELSLGSYQSAWHMAHRIRHAMRSEPLSSMLLKGVVEVDETYVGPKHVHGKRGRGAGKKVPIVALVERGGRVHARVVPNVTAKTLKEALREVDRSATIMTDEFSSYTGPGKVFASHQTVDHSAGEYVRYSNQEDKPDAYTNTAESFFSLMKRGITGSQHHVSKKHLQRYVDEYVFRWGHRETTDSERTDIALRLADGKRLMYKEPVGRSLVAP